MRETLAIILFTFAVLAGFLGTFLAANAVFELLLSWWYGG